MKRINGASCLQVCITLAVLLLLSACAAEKRVPQNHTPPDDAVYIAESKMVRFEMSAPAGVGLMVEKACAGPACDLFAQVEKPVASAPAQRSFPAAESAPEPEPAIDRQAGAAPAVSDSDNVDDVKRGEKEVAPPVGAYRQPAHRVIPEYRRNGK